MKKEFLITGGILAAMFADAAELTKAELQKRLKALAKEPAPTNLAPGAMCYKVAVNPLRVEYACPVCAEKTLYAEANRWDLVANLASYRAAVDKFNKLGLNCALDETEFCAKCGKGVKPQRLYLVVRHEDKSESKTALQGESDLQIISAFLEKKDRYTSGNDAEIPLKKQLPRLKQLLGIEVK